MAERAIIRYRYDELFAGRSIAELARELNERGTDQAVAAWEDAVARNDIPTERAMIKRAFPQLTLAPPWHFDDHGPERFQRDGPAS